MSSSYLTSICLTFPLRELGQEKMQEDHVRTRVLAQVVGQALTCCFLASFSQKAAPQGALDMLLSPGSLCSCPSVLACL